MDVDALDVVANLSGPGVHASDELADETIRDRGALEDERRIVPAELQADVLDRVGGLAHELFSGLGAAGEADPPDCRVPGEGGTDLGAGSGHRIEDARG